MGLKNSGFDADAAAGYGDEVFVQGAGLFGGRGVVETGAASFAAIAIEGELRDDQHRAAGIEQAAVHFAVFILEDAKVQDLLCDEFGVSFGIEFRHAQQDEEAGADFADDGPIDKDTRFGYAL